MAAVEQWLIMLACLLAFIFLQITPGTSIVSFSFFSLSFILKLIERQRDRGR